MWDYKNIKFIKSKNKKKAGFKVTSKLMGYIELLTAGMIDNMTAHLGDAGLQVQILYLTLAM